MKSNIEQKSYSEEDQYRLFKSFAESLKTPLIQIARTTEHSHQTGQTSLLPNAIIAADGLDQLIDNYLLSLELNILGEEIMLSPVSIGAILDDTAHALQKQADKYSCDLELHVDGKYGPILAHPAGLRAALTSIGSVMIDAQNQQVKTKRQVIKLAAHRTRYGIVAGLFADVTGISPSAFKASKTIYGDAKQPLSQLISSPSGGIFVADSILSTMSSGLRVARYKKLNGLAATFIPSRQLALV